MSDRPTPSFESRRRSELQEELLQRARVWLPEWRPRQPQGELAAALFGLAARIGAEVTRRLDRVPEKTARGFYAWLGIGAQPGLAARLPVVFNMNAKGTALDAAVGTQVQASLPDKPVVLETEQALRILPGAVVAVVAVDPQFDAFFLPPPRIIALSPPKAPVSEWRLKSDAGPAATQIQLEPAVGIEIGMLLCEPTNTLSYQVKAAADGGLVTIAPGIGTENTALICGTTQATNGLAEGSRLLRVDSFTPFDGAQRNRQEHALYIGAMNALDIQTAAVIEIVSDQPLPSDACWSFWGKTDPDQAPDWIRMQGPVFYSGRMFLGKPAGTIEPLSLDNHKSRWLRAQCEVGNAQLSQNGGLALKVNCDVPTDSSSGARQPVPALQCIDASPSQPALEGFANTAPLVLSDPFYPLGREPRLFDAFYLGCQEAFSKPRASVLLDFTLGDEFDSPLICARMNTDASGEHLVVAVGEDRRLRRVAVTNTAGESPVITFLTSTCPVTTEGRTLPLQGATRPGATTFLGLAYVSVVSERTVYLFSQIDQKDAGSWVSLGEPVGSKTDATGALGDTALLVKDGALIVYALVDGTLYRRKARVQDPWVVAHAAAKRIARIAPALLLVEEGKASSSEPLVCVGSDGTLALLQDAKWRQLALEHAVDAEVYPLAFILPGGENRCFARVRGDDRLVAFDLEHWEPPAPVNAGVGSSAVRMAGPEVSLRERTVPAALLGSALSFAWRGSAPPLALLVIQDNGRQRPAVWDGYDEDELSAVGDSPAGSHFVEAPVAAGRIRLFPGENSALTVCAGDETVQDNVELWIDQGLVVTATHLEQAEQYFIVNDENSGDAVLRATWLVRAGIDRAVLELAWNEERNVLSPEAKLYAQADETTWAGELTSTTELQLQTEDDQTREDSDIWILKDELYYVARVSTIQPSGDLRIAVLNVSKQVDFEHGGKCEYGRAIKIDTESIAARLLVTPVGLTAEARSTFPRVGLRLSDPAIELFPQEVLVYDETITLVVAPPTGDSSLQQDTTASVINLGALTLGPLVTPPRPRNPDLSWEYWNGSGWWKIAALRDPTENLVKSGQIEFCVPKDLKPTDVMGRTNCWIRARLVGGDFGEATFVVQPGVAGQPQAVTRTLDGVRAPYVLALGVSYGVCCAVPPDFVLTGDGGGRLRNQTEANQLAGALLEHFIPLSIMLQRVESASSNSAQQAADRALFVGIDSELEGDAIHLLFVLEDGEHDLAYPLRVEALLDGSFQALAAVEDGTRGLNETGIVSFDIAKSPPQFELFGQACFWLRIRPNPRFDATQWRPRIRGVYLNVAWAHASETQREELLGSSDGSPEQRVVLARSPVLKDTLQLYVREPLAEEEQQLLRADDSQNVLPELGHRGGPWVRWSQVVDPLDEPAGSRVYALDHAAGSISFGDGLHGMIPPIGRDVIMAHEYRHGGGEAANQIAAWAELNLLTPLQGVEGATCPVGAAGGSDPQDAATALRFAPANLRVRDRCLTLRDFEDLALQASPHVAQARARLIGSEVRVVVVMRGADPLPSSATRRELTRYLLERAAPVFVPAGGLRVIGPRLARLRITVSVTIRDLDASGEIRRAIVLGLQRLLDPALGGLDGRGFPLGQVPADAEIAASLLDIDDIDSLDRLSLERVDEQGAALQLSAALGPQDLAWIVPDRIQVLCAVAEGAA
jgi:hypothetical protein